LNFIIAGLLVFSIVSFMFCIFEIFFTKIGKRVCLKP